MFQNLSCQQSLYLICVCRSAWILCTGRLFSQTVLAYLIPTFISVSIVIKETNLFKRSLWQPRQKGTFWAYSIQIPTLPSHSSGVLTQKDFYPLDQQSLNFYIYNWAEMIFWNVLLCYGHRNSYLLILFSRQKHSASKADVAGWDAVESGLSKLSILYSIVFLLIATDAVVGYLLLYYMCRVSVTVIF